MQTAECTACGWFAGDASVVLFFELGALNATSLVGVVYFNVFVSIRLLLRFLVARSPRSGIERARERM
jgi:hypothetical protein